MANVNLRTSDARRKLTRRHAPHWTKLIKGLALGYRRSKSAPIGTWIGRRLIGGDEYTFQSFGPADDSRADGELALSYDQALEAVLEWGKADSTTTSSRYKVNQAANRYLEYVRAETKAVRDTERRITRDIHPRVGAPCPGLPSFVVSPCPLW